MDDLSGKPTLGKRREGGWSLAEGETLGGYRVVKPLGRGGMGEVYLAENVQTGVKFALKLLPPELARDNSFRERFRREAGLLQTLRHEGIVQVLHAAEEGGRFFLTMDYVDGGSLDDRLKADGKLAEDETARIALELCDALAYAHGKGVIHRDIKPANVLLDKDGRAKLSDFGLARVVGDDFLKSMTQRSISLSMARTDGGGLSQSDNAVIGTYEYMSPEQKAGAPADERSDIFSLGLMIYRMLTGEKPEGVFDMPSDLGCSDAWDGIVQNTLTPKPERRYARVVDLAEVVGQAAEEVAVKRAPRQEKDRRRAAEPGGRAPEAGEQRRGAESGDTLRGRTWAEAQPSPSPGGGHPTVDTRKGASPSAQPRSRKGLVAILGTIVGVGAAIFGFQAREAARRRERPALATASESSSSLPKTLSLECGGGVTMECVLIPAGEFMMGRPDLEPGSQRNEVPQHRVRMTKPFYMGKYEVTQEQYEVLMGTNPSENWGAKYPVEKVSWDDAMEFCKKMSRRVGKTVRLPTEAEWEYACRAGSTARFSCGDSYEALGDYAWCSRNSLGTHPVGLKLANVWGLHDMHGNVWEWVSDWYDNGYYAKSPDEDPTGPPNGRYHVIRGGSWTDSFDFVYRSAFRGYDDPHHRVPSSGFRVAVEASP